MGEEWGCTPLIQALGRQRQEGLSSRTARAMWREPILKQEKQTSTQKGGNEGGKEILLFLGFYHRLINPPFPSIIFSTATLIPSQHEIRPLQK